MAVQVVDHVCSRPAELSEQWSCGQDTAVRFVTVIADQYENRLVVLLRFTLNIFYLRHATKTTQDTPTDKDEYACSIEQDASVHGSDCAAAWILFGLPPVIKLGDKKRQEIH